MTTTYLVFDAKTNSLSTKAPATLPDDYRIDRFGRTYMVYLFSQLIAIRDNENRAIRAAELHAEHLGETVNA